MSLTPTEIKAIQGIIDSDYRDGDHPVGATIWSWSGNPFKSKRTFSGAVSSLVKKGYVVSDEYGSTKDENTLTLTQAGYDAFVAAIGSDPFKEATK